LEGKEKRKRLEQELFSMQGSDFMGIGAANEAVSELISKAGIVWDSGDQQFFVLEGEEVKEVISKLAGQAPQGFVQTSEWMQPTAPPGPLADELLQDMGKHLQDVVTPEELAAADEVHCQCGEDVYVLPDGKAMQEFVANLGVSDASAYTKTSVWNKQQGDADNKQLALLADIAARLQTIETILLRLEQSLKID